MHLRKTIAAGLSVLCFCFSASGQESGGVDAKGNKSYEASQTVSTDRNIDLKNFQPSLYNPNFSGSPYRTPFIRSEENSGTLATWMGFGLMGRGTYGEHPYLLVNNGAALGLSRDFGKLSFNVYGSVNLYSYELARDRQFGIDGNISYAFNDHVSATAFGQFYDKVPYYSMAAYPFVNTQRFGGFVTVSAERVGVDLGVERYYDPFVRQWVTQPIVTPKIKLGESVYIGIPVGGAIKAGSDMIMHKHMMKNAPPPPRPPQRH